MYVEWGSGWPGLAAIIGWGMYCTVVGVILGYVVRMAGKKNGTTPHQQRMEQRRQPAAIATRAKH